MSRKFDPFAALPRATGCEPFVTALDVRSRGALAERAVPVLEAHLAGCEACRQRAERLAGLPPPSHVAPVDWQEARAALLERLHAHRRAPWYGAAFGVLMPLFTELLQALAGDPLSLSLRRLAPSVLVVIVMVIVMRRYTRRAARLLATDDLVTAYRQDLQQIRRQARFIMPGMLVAGLALGLLALVTALGPLDSARARTRLINASVAGIILMVGTAYYGREVRKTTRVLDELGG